MVNSSIIPMKFKLLFVKSVPRSIWDLTLVVKFKTLLSAEVIKLLGLGSPFIVRVGGWEFLRISITSYHLSIIKSRY